MAHWGDNTQHFGQGGETRASTIHTESMPTATSSHQIVDVITGFILFGVASFFVFVYLVLSKKGKV